MLPLVRNVSRIHLKKCFQHLAFSSLVVAGMPQILKVKIKLLQSPQVLKPSQKHRRLPAARLAVLAIN